MTKGNPKWERWEKAIQETFGLDSAPGSGNQFNAPGDAVNNTNPHEGGFRLFVDCKFTEKLSYSLKRADWEKWCERAAEAGKRPAMAIRIWPNELVGPMDAVVISVDDLAELLSKAEKLDAIDKAYHEMLIERGRTD
jgi:hypothetical protein